MYTTLFGISLRLYFASIVLCVKYCYIPLPFLRFSATEMSVRLIYFINVLYVLVFIVNYRPEIVRSKL